MWCVSHGLLTLSTRTVYSHSLLTHSAHTFCSHCLLIVRSHETHSPDAKHHIQSATLSKSVRMAMSKESNKQQAIGCWHAAKNAHGFGASATNGMFHGSEVAVTCL